MTPPVVDTRRPRIVGAPRAWVVGTALIVAACAPPTAGEPPMHSREAVPAWRARPSGGTEAIDAERGRVARDATGDLLDASGCARCHAAIVDEWAASRHALAWTNAIFQREYSGRPLSWCVNCHAPLVTQQAGRFMDRGVDCASCHVRDGALVSTTRRPSSPHATVEDPSFGSPAYCADCHEFTYPVLSKTGAVVRMTAHPMQATVASFAAGPYATQPGGCMACHGSKQNHAFAGGHDPAMLDAALEVEWCVRAGSISREPQEIVLSVKNAAAGHTVPTGDIHRHMNLRVWRSSAPEQLFEAFYGRRFEPAEDGGSTTIWDSTIAPSQVRRHAVALAALGGDPDEPINLALEYVFLKDDLAKSARAVAEPSTTTVLRRRAAIADLPPCK